jgi:hypothetical protein
MIFNNDGIRFSKARSDIFEWHYSTLEQVTVDLLLDGLKARYQRRIYDEARRMRRRDGGDSQIELEGLVGTLT